MKVFLSRKIILTEKNPYRASISRLELKNEFLWRGRDRCRKTK